MMTVIRSCNLELDLVLEEEVSSAVNGDSIDDDPATFVEWLMSSCLQSMVMPVMIHTPCQISMLPAN